MENKVGKNNEFNERFNSGGVGEDDFNLSKMFSDGIQKTSPSDNPSQRDGDFDKLFRTNTKDNQDGSNALRESFQNYTYHSSKSDWEAFKKKTNYKFKWKGSVLFNKAAEIFLFAIITFTIVNWLPQSGLIMNDSRVNWDKIFAMSTKIADESDATQHLQLAESSFISMIKASVPKFFHDEEIPAESPLHIQHKIDTDNITYVAISKQKPVAISSTTTHLRKPEIATFMSVFPENFHSTKKNSTFINVFLGKNFGTIETPYYFNDQFVSTNDFIFGATIEKDITDHLSVEAGLVFKKSSFIGLADGAITSSTLAVPVRIKYDVVETKSINAYVFGGVQYNRMLSDPVEAGFQSVENEKISSEMVHNWRKDYVALGQMNKDQFNAQVGLGVEGEIGDSSKVFASLYYNHPWSKKNFKNGVLGVEIGMKLKI